MLICEVITQVDSEVPNDISESVKLTWLKCLDDSLRRSYPDKVLSVDSAPAWQAKYPNEMLALPLMYQGIYKEWLRAQILFAQGEITRYSNAMQLYNAHIEELSRA